MGGKLVDNSLRQVFCYRMIQMQVAMSAGLLLPGAAKPSSSKADKEGKKAADEVMEPSYREKLLLVGRFLEVETTLTKKPGNFALSAGSEKLRETCSLPPSPSFMGFFEKYMAELTGAEGSERARKKPGECYEVGSVLRKTNVRMGSYKILDCPWKVTAQTYDKPLLVRVLYTGKEAPKMVIPEGRLRDMEMSSREMLSMISYMDMFTAASIKSMESASKCLDADAPQRELALIMEKLAARGVSHNVLSQLEEFGQDVFKTNQQTWNSCQDNISLLHSVGKAVQGCVNNCVYNVSMSMISRRDV